MCGGGSSSSSNTAQQQAIATQQQTQQAQLSADQLAQEKTIADQQASFNQSQLDYQKSQDQVTQQNATNQANLQTTWDAARNANAASATGSINSAFSQFTPQYFQDYADTYAVAGDNEIGRQQGLAQQQATYGLARAGQLQGSNAAYQQGQIDQTAGKAMADQANAAQTAANTLQSNTLNAKSSLTSQALSTDTLGSPIASTTSDGVQSAIDASNRALSGVTANAGSYAASVNPVSPTLGSLAGIFSGAASGVAAGVSGVNQANTSAAFGQGLSGGLNASSTSGGGSLRQY